MSSAQPHSPNATEDQLPGQERSAHLETMRTYDVARLEALQDMAESFCTWLHALGAEQMEKGGDDAVPRVRELSNSFNKAARAARLTVTLKHEVAGLRPLRNARVAAPANQNAPAPAQPVLDRWDPRRTEWTPEESAEMSRESLESEEFMDEVLGALRKDMDAARMDKSYAVDLINGATMLQTIPPMIPHPRMDRVLADRAWKNLLEAIPQHLIYPLPTHPQPGHPTPPGTDPPE
jgi:hypothetical protein